MKIEKHISPFIASQFPSFYREEGPNFVAFVQAYYEWLEETGNVVNRSRTMLDTIDIDETEMEFIKYFKHTYISSIPESIIADKRLVVKHILDLYRSKGTDKAIKLLFRMLFNEDVTVNVPNQYIFKPSDADWITPQYVEISDNPFLQNLVGKQIYSPTAKGVVENSFNKVVNNKVINVLNISSVDGKFKFNEKIYCDDLYVNSIDQSTVDYRQYTLLNEQQKLNYSLAINGNNAPIVFGSLSTLGIINGGANYNVGDLLSVEGTGAGAVAKVISTRNENGKVAFTLINGGHGFSVNAIITVTGGAGSGASFRVGDITDKVIYRINSDIIGDYKDTTLDNVVEGFFVNINSSSGNMTIDEYVTSSANVVSFDVLPAGGIIANGDILSNTSLGISNILVSRSEGSYLQITGSETNILNANLVAGATLVNTLGSAIIINTSFPKTTITGSGQVLTSNSTQLLLNEIDGYFIANATITGTTSGKTAVVEKTIRNTNWEFPNAVDMSNLDFPSIVPILHIFDIEAGTITYLKGVNPGIGYSSNPEVVVIEPYIYDLKIPNSTGGFYGYDATVTAKAGTAVGIVNGITIEDSGYGYSMNEILTLSKVGNPTSVTASSVIDLNGIGSGFWNNNKSFLSDEIFIEDSDFYQTFSYEIEAKRMKHTYEYFINDLVHPSGFKMFGKFINYNELTSELSSTSDFSIQQS